MYSYQIFAGVRVFGGRCTEIYENINIITFEYQFRDVAMSFL